jgi:hypothetical protein
VDGDPTRLGYRVSLAAVMRNASMANEARDYLSRAVSDSHKMVDVPEVYRGAIYELGVIAGVLGEPEVNAYLALRALADDPGERVKIPEMDQVELVSTSLRLAFEAIARSGSEEWLEEGMSLALSLERAVATAPPGDELKSLVDGLEEMAKSLGRRLRRNPWARDAEATELTFHQVKKVIGTAARAGL